MIQKTGYIGYSKADKAIWIAFSPGNGKEDEKEGKGKDSKAEQVLVPYTSWPECIDCEIFTGALKDSEKLYEDFKPIVDELIAENPDYESINLTGFSYGGIMSHLTGMLLIRDGYSGVQQLNFAMPRLGNEQYAAYSNSVWEN